MTQQQQQLLPKIVFQFFVSMEIFRIFYCLFARIWFKCNKRNKKMPHFLRMQKILHTTQRVAKRVTQSFCYNFFFVRVAFCDLLSACFGFGLICFLLKISSLFFNYSAVSVQYTRNGNGNFLCLKKILEQVTWRVFLFLEEEVCQFWWRCLFQKK